MIDQRVREGSKVNFFGSLATTTTIPAQLVKKYKCDLVPIYIERRSKFHFKMYVSKPIKVSESKTIEEITQFKYCARANDIKKSTSMDLDP